MLLTCSTEARRIRYLKDEYQKQTIVMSARGHIGREVIDAKRDGVVNDILYADDFEYRLNMDGSLSATLNIKGPALGGTLIKIRASQCLHCQFSKMLGVVKSCA